jgi:hypothetical protein
MLGPPIVVPSPRPTIPSEQWIRTTTIVCLCIVAIDSTCGRMVGRSTKKVSIRSISTMSRPI